VIIHEYGYVCYFCINKQNIQIPANTSNFWSEKNGRSKTNLKWKIIIMDSSYSKILTEAKVCRVYAMIY